MDNKEPENKDNINQIENQPKKRGRPKKYDFAGLSKEDYDKKYYEVNKDKFTLINNNRKEENKERYKNNKNAIKEQTTKNQKKYRDSYKILFSLYNKNQIQTDEETLIQIRDLINN
jgi:hypothetical protein